MYLPYAEQPIFKSQTLFILLASFVGIGAFLNAGYISIGVILLFLFCLYNRLSGVSSRPKKQVALLFPIALFLLETLWLMFASSPAEALANLWIKKNSMFLLPVAFLLFREQISKKQFETVLLLFLIAFFITSLICYANAAVRVLENKSFSEVNIDRKYYYFSYLHLTEPSNSTPIYLGLFANFAFVIALYKTAFSQTLRIASLIYIGIFIILVASKIAIISLVVTIFAFFVYRRRSLLKSFLLFLLLGGLMATSVYIFPFLRERFLTSVTIDYKQPYASAWNSTSLRLAIWNCTVEAIKRKPLLGYGTADGQRALEDVYRERGFVRGEEDRYNPHNQFMITMLDLGIIGALLLFIMLAYPFVEAIKSGNMLAASFLIIVFLVFCIEGLLVRQKGIAFFSFFYSLLTWHRKTEV